jgi:hypothetical protein
MPDWVSLFLMSMVVAASLWRAGKGDELAGAFYVAAGLMLFAAFLVAGGNG